MAGILVSLDGLECAGGRAEGTGSAARGSYLARPLPGLRHARPHPFRRSSWHRRVSCRCRSGHQQWSPVVLHRRFSPGRRAGGKGTRQRGAGQCRYSFPLRRITVNLAPADIRKNGSGLDLPIAVGLLIASEQLPDRDVGAQLIVGEVGLEGDLRPVRGALSMALAARALGCRGILVPEANLAEAAVVEGLEVRGARTLTQVCAHLAGSEPLVPARVDLRALMARPSARTPISPRCARRRRPAGPRGRGGRRARSADDRPARLG